MNDYVNGFFELVGAALLWLNVLRIRRDRTLMGVSAIPVAFFTAWGLWNLYYYPSLGQWASFWGGVAMVVVNLVWLAHVVCLWLEERREEREWRTVLRNSLRQRWEESR